MLENKFVRAVVFFAGAFGIPVELGIYFEDFNQGILSGVLMGIIFAVMSQFFEPKTT